ncbi:type ISP restriction/modification enzyme, partial [Escherichia coli]
MIVYYNFQVNEKKKDPEFKEIIDTTRISWNRSLLNDFNKLKNHSFDKNCIYKSVYRPFNKSNLYFSRALNDMVYQMPQLFPTADSDNLVIYINGSGNGGKP